MHQDDSLYRFEAVTVDCGNYRVQNRGAPVTLTPRAFDVLVLLIRNGGRVVEKQEIFDEVWKDTFVGDNALSKVIKEIRHALGDNAADPRIIETVPKRGYRFIATLAATSPMQEAPDPESAGAAPDPDAHLTRPQISEPRTVNRQLLVAATVGLVLISAFIYLFLHISDSSKTVIDEPIDSIAVLPLQNSAQDADTEYLADGITDSRIDRLSLLTGLRVSPKSAAYRYRNGPQDGEKMAEALNVRSLLTGSVSRVGDQLVIRVSLDDIKGQRHLWGQQYVRGLSDILAVQDNIVQDVTANLRLKLTSPERERLSKKYTENSEAYDLYLKGQYEWKKHTLGELQKSIKFYNEAIAKDPQFALAYAGLATSYAVLGNDYLPPNDAYPKAKAYAAKALAIDATLAEAHTAMAAVRLYYDWNWEATENELQQARTLDPKDADAYLLNGDYLDAVGRFDEARAETRRALDIDPLSAMFNTNTGIALYYARQYDDAIIQLQKTIDLEPRFVNAYLYLGQAYEQKGLYQNAIETFEKGMSNAERHPQLIAALGHGYALAGSTGKAKAALAELLRMSKGGYINPYLFAVVYAGLGDKAHAMDWLAKAFADRSFFVIWVNVEPQFDLLRNDPAFRALVKTLGPRR